MTAVNKVIENIENYLEIKISDQQVLAALIQELTATVEDLIQHPHLPITPKLRTLFSRYDVEPQITDSLIKSLTVAISKQRKQQQQQVNDTIESLDFELVDQYQQLVVERTLAKIAELRPFPADKIVEIVQEAAIPLAKIVGSNVAEGLALQDPGAVVQNKHKFIEILHNDKRLDPIQITNSFTGLSDQQRRIFADILAHHITRAQQENSEREERLLRNGRVPQWIYDRLRDHGVPHNVAHTLAGVMLEEFGIERLANMNAYEIRGAIAQMISKLHQI